MPNAEKYEAIAREFDEIPMPRSERAKFKKVARILLDLDATPATPVVRVGDFVRCAACPHLGPLRVTVLRLNTYSADPEVPDPKVDHWHDARDARPITTWNKP